MPCLEAELPLQIWSWYLGVLGYGWKEQRATTVFVWCCQERGVLLSGLRRLIEDSRKPSEELSVPSRLQIEVCY